MISIERQMETKPMMKNPIQKKAEEMEKENENDLFSWNDDEK